MAPIKVNKEALLAAFAETGTVEGAALKIGVCRQTAAKHLRDYDVKYQIGGKRAILNGALSDSEMELVTAGVIGDGSIRPNANNTSARFSLRSKHLEYLEWYGAQFSSQKYNIVHKLRTDPRQPGREYWSGQIDFQYSPEVLEIRNLWYDENRVKRIPASFKLTPTIALHWYLQDGHLSTYKYDRTVYLSTDCFPKEDVDRLCEMMKDFRAKPKIDTRGHYKIRIPAGAVPAFFEYIGGGSPVPCFDYKFDLRKGPRSPGAHV